MAENQANDNQRPRRGITRRTFLKGAAAGAGVAATDIAALSGVAYGAPNPISVENALAGNPPDEWESYEDESIEGFATQFSVNRGETVKFKVKTDARSWRIVIYRMGWYGGLGARRVDIVNPSVSLPQSQPNPIEDVATGLVDAGNWAVSAQWPVPVSAVSGVYQATFERLDNGRTNRTLFVVRDDGRQSDLLVQTSDTTMHAYNRWGGNSLYYGTNGRAYKVSYNRPFRIDGYGNNFFDAEYALVRWLERNGYDVTYCAGIDSHLRPLELRRHKVFVSSGHDEYWSGAQRANVEAARDAGVHLAFISGNEVFWKTRWEPSIDGSNTPNRTLVCYKETAAGAQLDPSPEWTGTWRDPRFSPPEDGGRPEGTLTGQIFGAINDETQPDHSIMVPEQYKTLRFWRNSAVTQLLTGQSRQIGDGTLGYEWDVEPVDGQRPAGHVRLSETTVTVPSVLIDYGTNYAAGPATHHLSLYRASSGALVFGSGTCQWAWALDEYHRRESGPADRAAQQATLNLLADMGCQPSTRQSDLMAASASTDLTPPVSVVTNPPAGSVVAIGNPVTVTGTASDAAGVVANVEVSTDGGATWTRASGRSTWSHTFIPTTLGPITIKTRATDDSINTETPGPGRTLTGGPRPYPCFIWHPSITPTNPSTNDGNPIEIGCRFRTAVDGFILGARFYKGTGNTGSHVGQLWTSTGQLLASKAYVNETATGWQEVRFTNPVPVAAGTTYVVSTFCPNGHYAADASYFSRAYDVYPLRALADNEDGRTGVYRYGSTGFPTDTYQATNYWVDVVFDESDYRAPTVIDHSPAPGLEGVTTQQPPIKAIFSEAMNPTSIQMELRPPTGPAIAGSVSYDATTRTAMFLPSAALAPMTLYTARVITANDKSGQAMAASDAWTFTTTGGPNRFPITLWDTSFVPAVAPVNDFNAVELGTKFTCDVGALVTAIRFYKPPTAQGPFVGHLWNSSGALLATAPFQTTTAEGWQQVRLTQPISINPGELYTVSVQFPSGRYGATSGVFGSSGRDNGPLHGPRSATVGGNGVYRYGPAAFPTSSYGDSSYFVDVVVTDLGPPTIIGRSPASGATDVSVSTVARATFSEGIDPATLSFTLRRQSGGTNVTGSVVYDAATRTATFTPSAALLAATAYTATVSASDLAGNAMTSADSWSFTTASTEARTILGTTTPSDASVNDNSAVELGMRFRSDVAGRVIGVRFYKGAGSNGGTHTGRLYRASDGALLGQATFSSETNSGWQSVNFTTPVTIVAGEVYVVSYHAPQGKYSATAGAFGAAGVDSGVLHALRDGDGGVGNGLYRYGPGGVMPNGSYNATNYFVDVLFREGTA